MVSTTHLLEILTLVLFIAAVVSLATRRLRLPYTVGLVIIGLLLGMVTRQEAGELPQFIDILFNFVSTQLTPDIIIGLLVTPLVFEAAFHILWDNLSRDLGLVLALAVPGVIVTTLLVGVIVYLGTEYSFPIALVFGALISATDPVSVVAVFRTMGVPKRLQLLLEGESLFNDGTSIVLFSLVVGIALGATDSDGGSWIIYLTDFLRVAGGGLAVGFLLGWLLANFIGQIDDHLVETTLTTTLAFGAYLSAEELGVSGILAVVAAGLVSGNLGPKGMSPTTRIVVTNFWEYAAFISNSIVFLLIGLEMDLDLMIRQWPSILLAILAVLLSRAVFIYGLALLNPDVPRRWSHVLLWGGLRGAVSLALALSIPLTLGAEEVSELRAMAFGVVLFTILVQGFTMGPLVRRMELIKRSEMREEYERRQARAVAIQAAYDRLKRMNTSGLLSSHSWMMIEPLLRQRGAVLAEAVKEVMQDDPTVEDEELDTARREALRAERSALISLVTDGVISEEVYSQLAREVDMAITEDQTSWAGMLKPDRMKPIRRLMTAVIQIQDFENAVNALTAIGLTVTHMSSSGGFLGRRNVTLLIGMSEGQEAAAVNALSKSCRRRVEYVATPLEGAPFHLPLSTPVTVGGATIFTFEVERYEEIL